MLSLTLTIDESGWLTPRPGCFTPGKAPVIHFTGSLVGSRAGVENLASLLGFDPRTVKPVASRYTDCFMTARFPLHIQV